MPNQQGGVFRRDSAQSRLESLLGSPYFSPKRNSLRFVTESGECSETGDSEYDRGDSSLCEADRIELEFLKGSADEASNDDEDGRRGRANITFTLEKSLDTSKNTVYNSTMSHRGSITKFLLQQQLPSMSSRSPSPLSDLCRGSAQGNQSSRGGSSRSSISSFFGGSTRTSFSASSKSRGSNKPTPTDSRRDSSSVLGESLTSGDTSELNSSEMEPEIEKETTTDHLRVDAQSRRESGTSTVVASRLESGQSTVVCSNRSSVIKVAGSPRVSQVGDSVLYRSVNDAQMLHVLAARLLQAKKEESGNDEEHRESVV